MFNNKYFCYVFNTSFESKCKEPTWNRTEGVERQLCNLLSESRDVPITYSQVRSLTGWANLAIRKWFAALLTAGVFTDADTSRTQRWRLVRGFSKDRAELTKLIPPIGSTIVSARQVDYQPKSMQEDSIPIDTIGNNVDEEYRLPGIDVDDSDDFFSVFSR